MKKIITAVTIVIALAALMFSEYRFIMHNIQPYYADGYVYIDFLGHVDAYYNEPLFSEE